jgi:hypothetical protein
MHTVLKKAHTQKPTIEITYLVCGLELHGSQGRLELLVLFLQLAGHCLDLRKLVSDRRVGVEQP